jgi:cytoskeletal protein RodZ
MKEIGEKLKDTRESIGISIEEAAEDLKLRASQIENIEAGNMEAFKDIFYLKYFIRDYSKYLGLKYEDMVDEFNEYLFDYTSKISIEDIKKAKKKMKNAGNEDKNKKIVSPYTLEHKRKIVIPPLVTYIMIIILIVVIGYLVISIIDEDNYVDESVVVNIVK